MMANPNPRVDHLKDTQFKQGESGNPNGAPKGNIHLSTHIKNMLNDDDFELKLKDGSLLKGAPIKAIIKTAVAKGISGDTRAMEWLAKHGYGNKLDITSGGERLNVALVEFVNSGNNKDSSKTSL